MVYLDTSILAPLFLRERASAKIEEFVIGIPVGELAMSHWTRLEFSSVLAREVRAGALSREVARRAGSEFDAIAGESFVIYAPSARDFDLAKEYVHRYDSGLRAGDALHLAIASNHRARAIYSLDKQLMRAGKILGLPVQSGISPP